MLQILMNAAMVTISVNETQIVSTVLVVTAVNVLQGSNFHPTVPVLVRFHFHHFSFMDIFPLKDLCMHFSHFVDTFCCNSTLFYI